MKKRFFALILTLCMVLNMMPSMVFGVEVEAQWGVAETNDSVPTSWVSQGSLVDAVIYANTLTNGTAYIQILKDINTAAAYTFNGLGKTTTLDLNSKSITRSTSNDENSPVIIVSNGILNVIDNSVSKVGTVLNTVTGNDTCGIMQTGGTVNFYSGRILASGQAYYLTNGLLNMYGGELIGLWKDGDTSVHEGICATGGSFNIYAGYLSGKNAFYKANNVIGNVIGGYYSDNSIDGFVNPAYALGNLSSSGISDIIMPQISAGGITYGPYTFSKWVYQPNLSGLSLAIPFTAVLSEQLTAKFMEGATERFLTASYTWERSSDGANWTEISGATYKDYVIGSDDLGKQIRVKAKIGDNTLTSNIAAVEPPDLLPTITSVSVPSHGTYTTGQNLDFTVHFDEVVTLDTTGGTPYVALTFSTGGTTHAAYVSGSGTSSLVFRYTVQAGENDADGITVGTAIILNGGSIKDSTGNDATLTLNNTGSTAAVLVDTLAPTTSAFSPLNNATQVDINTNLVMTFSEAVAKGTGNIVIKRASDNSIFETIDVNSNKVTGEGTATITINPSATLLEGTDYYIQIAAAAFDDIAGNQFAGISDVTSWTFRTINRIPVNIEDSPVITPTPTPAPSAVNVVVNGKVENLGTEESSIIEGKSTVTVTLNNQTIESKINEAVKDKNSEGHNLIQVVISDTQSEVSRVELTGNIVKKLEENAFDVSVKRGQVEYIIPADEFTISKVASKLGILEDDLKSIKVEVQIAKLDQTLTAKYNDFAKENGAELVFPPVSFEVVAKTTKADGTKETVEISKFNSYVERIVEIPSNLDPSKITTGIVFNTDGTYSHVPTEAFQSGGKWYAKLNSLANSDYAIIWNPIKINSVENHWSKDTVNDLASRLVIFNAETFDPSKDITRADFAEYIIRALGLYREGSVHENIFSDVSEANDRALAIHIANEYGIITGYQDGTFRPGKYITREEAMMMFQRAMKLTNLKGNDLNRYQNFTDFNQVSEWASSSVKEVLSAHIFNGIGETRLDPKSAISYAEAAQAIKNLLVESKLINK